jgi:hypothetical protein
MTCPMKGDVKDTPHLCWPTFFLVSQPRAAWS